MKVFICISVFVSIAYAAIIHGSEDLLDGGLPLGGSDSHLGESLELDAGYAAGGYGYDVGLIGGGEEALLEGGTDLRIGDALGEGHSIADLSLASSAGLGYAGGYAAGYEDWC